VLDKKHTVNQLFVAAGGRDTLSSLHNYYSYDSYGQRRWGRFFDLEKRLCISFDSFSTLHQPCFWLLSKPGYCFA